MASLPEISDVIEIQIAPDQVGLRLDRVLALHPAIKTRSRAEKLIDAGRVRLKGKVIKASQKAQANDTVEISLPPPESTNLKPFEFNLEILFEDLDIIVVNKPAGLVVHPAAGHASDTLVNALIHQSKDLAMGFGVHRPGIVHRLDKDTSGVLVVAKNDFAQEELAKQFRARTIHRIYWAIVHGKPKHPRGRIETYLRRHPTDRKRFASERLSADSEPKGKRAITHYKMLNSNLAGVSLLECRLETGRTHQIRVHLSELGHPIIGDKLYGAGSRLSAVKSEEINTAIRSLTRIGLHACELGFIHPRNHAPLRFLAPWPNDLASLVESLKWT